jgi:hypothetical protein
VQSELCVQGRKVHVPVPHRPFSQNSPQHCSFVWQASPSFTQSQTPSEQTPVQQLADWWQSSPWSLHLAHVPPAQMPLQHCEPSTQVSPLSVQAQNPAWQSPLQQIAAAQLSPSRAHRPATSPASAGLSPPSPASGPASYPAAGLFPEEQAASATMAVKTMCRI